MTEFSWLHMAILFWEISYLVIDDFHHVWGKFPRCHIWWRQRVMLQSCISLCIQENSDWQTIFRVYVLFFLYRAPKISQGPSFELWSVYRLYFCVEMRDTYGTSWNWPPLHVTLIPLVNTTLKKPCTKELTFGGIFSLTNVLISVGEFLSNYWQCLFHFIPNFLLVPLTVYVPIGGLNWYFVLLMKAYILIPSFFCGYICFLNKSSIFFWGAPIKMDTRMICHDFPLFGWWQNTHFTEEKYHLHLSPRVAQSSSRAKALAKLGAVCCDCGEAGSFRQSGKASHGY